MKKLVADESVDSRVVKCLAEKGFEVFSISDGHRGIDDKKVLEIANQEKCLLITEDKDFGELTFRLGINNHGILLIRLAGLNGKEKSELVLKTLKKHYEEMQYSFSVMTLEKLRIKPL